MTGKQRAKLRSAAQGIDALYQLGKNEPDEDYIIQLGKGLDKNELIKIHVLESAPYTPGEAAAELAGRTDSKVVQIIGKKIVLYRPSRIKENRRLSEIISKL